MPYGFNDNTYKVLRTTSYRDVFEKQSYQLESNSSIGSAVANAIIVDEKHRAEVIGLEGNDYIDKMIELKYIELVI